MAISDLYPVFPKLEKTTHRETSKNSINYNCVAWAIEDQTRFWQPYGKVLFTSKPYLDWPSDLDSDDKTVEGFTLFFTRHHNYEVCNNGKLEQGFKKLAIYSQNGMFTHVARQKGNGKWTSKLGDCEDIEHQLDALESKSYGKVTRYLRRPR